MRHVRVLLLWGAITGIPGVLLATPIPASVGGTIATGSTGSVTGTAFTTNWAKPFGYSNFDSDANPVHSTLTSWSYNQNLPWSASGGFSGGGLVGTSQTDGNVGAAWTVQANSSGYGFNWNDNGKWLYVYRIEKLTFTITLDVNQPNFPSNNKWDNWKGWREWASGEVQPDLYFAANNGAIEHESAGTQGYGNFNPWTTANVWHRQEIIQKACSGNDVKDGVLIYRVDGNENANKSIVTRTSAQGANWPIAYPMHADAANLGSWNPPWSAANHPNVDELYISSTAARIMLGNASTYAGSTILTPQIIRTGGTTNVTFYWNTVGFNMGNTAYLYVVDDQNVNNANGFAVTIGSGGGGGGVPGPGPAPTALNSTASTSTTLTAAWTAPNPAGDTYTLEISPNSGFSSISSSATAGLSATVSGLSVNTLYFARVKATTGGVDSNYSTSVSTYTRAVQPAGGTWSAVGSQSATLTFTANGNPSGTTYTIDLSPSSSFASGVQSTSGTSLTHLFSGLTPNTVYYGRARSTAFSGALTGYQSASSTQTAIVSNAPTSLTYSGSSITSITGAWIAPSPPGDTYTFELNTAANFGGTSSTVTGTPVSNTIPGLSINTTYYGRVNAMVSGVTSEWSVSATTGTKANPPVSGSWTNVSGTALTVNWGLNSNPAGTHYQVDFSSVAAFANTVTTKQSDTFNQTFTGLIPGTVYHARVRTLAHSGFLTPYLTLANQSTSAYPPSIVGVSPNTGTTLGGEARILTGDHFVATPTVTLGGVSATDIIWANATTVTFVTPPHSAGAVSVVVTNRDFQSATGVGFFTYLAPGVSAPEVEVCPCVQ